MVLKDIFNCETLNIFADASTLNDSKGINHACYGAIAYCMNDELDTLIRISSDATNNNGEIKAIKCAVLLAYKYRKRFKQINIFSDSQISLCGIRDWIYNWEYFNGYLLNSSNDLVKSQEVFIDIINFIVHNNLVLNFYHQKGHVNTKYQNKLKRAISTFARTNRINGKIDYSFIRYISDCNNMIDYRTRVLLKRQNLNDNYFIDPIRFVPMDDFKNKIKEYKRLQEGH